jgi:hypothetical protein
VATILVPAGIIRIPEEGASTEGPVENPQKQQVPQADEVHGDERHHGHD